MLSSPNPKVTQPLGHVTRRLPNIDISASAHTPASVPIPALQTRPLIGPNTTNRLPTVIPASVKRQPVSSPEQQQQHRRHPITLLPLLLCTLIVGTLASLFAIPLNTNGQHPRTIAQTIGDWITTGSFGGVNPSQHMLTPTAAVQTGSGSGSCAGFNLWSTCSTDVTASGVMGTGVIQRPLAGAVITQVFGNPEYQSWCGCWRPHTGIDLATAYGSPVMAADSGQVIWTGWDTSGLGWAVEINHGHYISTIYGHMARFIVKVGQNVTKGQTVGYEGSTGASTGPHLHFMVLIKNVWVDPTPYVHLP